MSPQTGKLPGASPRTVSEKRQYLTPGQVAELWQLDVSTVYRLAASDPTIPVTRIGSSVRFRADRLEAWCAERTQGRERKASRTGRVTVGATANLTPTQAEVTEAH